MLNYLKIDKISEDIGKEMGKNSVLFVFLLTSLPLYINPVWSASFRSSYLRQHQIVKRQTTDQDFPRFNSIPRDLTFSCEDRISGYYADPQTDCQVWHWCTSSGYKYSFLCPNETRFNQQYRVCDWWYNVDCNQATSFYDINKDLYVVNGESTLEV
ncbi:U-scoloptoxin(01)-Cw1a-like [Tachypleus tridentatus]|uniref:U-scoloptoxin(01)-Cw1a-like n=1 Tax=Tachypleus tridentatus TaxID=6853 RepID=UPI003FD31CF6